MATYCTLLNTLLFCRILISHLPLRNFLFLKNLAFLNIKNNRHKEKKNMHAFMKQNNNNNNHNHNIIIIIIIELIVQSRLLRIRVSH